MLRSYILSALLFRVNICYPRNSQYVLNVALTAILLMVKFECLLYLMNGLAEVNPSYRLLETRDTEAKTMDW